MQRLRKPGSLHKKPSSLIPVRVRRPLAAVQVSAGKCKHIAKAEKTSVCTPINTGPHPPLEACTQPHPHYSEASHQTARSQNQQATSAPRHQPALPATTTPRYQPASTTVPRHQLAATPRRQPASTTASRNQLAETTPRHQPVLSQHQTTPRLGHLKSENMTAMEYTTPISQAASRQSSKVNNTLPRHAHWIHSSNKVSTQISYAGTKSII